MITKIKHYKLGVKFLILSVIILCVFETIALAGFHVFSRKMIISQMAERGVSYFTRATQKVYRQFECYDLNTEQGRLDADHYLRRTGSFLGLTLWLVDSNGVIYPSGFKPEERLLNAKPVPGYPDRFKIGQQMSPSRLTNLFRSPFPILEELLFRTPFEGTDGRNSYIYFAYKHRDSGFSQLYGIDHLPVVLAGYIGILSGLPLMLVILYLLVLRPISRLQKATTKIASGELSHRNQISGNDEIAELGRSFNHMVDQIEKMIESTRDVSRRLSHEFRSPMSRLSLKKDLILLELEKNKSDCNTRVLAEEMSEEIDQMNLLIDQMLDFARIDAGISKEPKTVVDFKDILKDTIDAYALDVQHQKIDIITQLTSDTVTVISREQDLLALCQNLISNALKFTQEKGLIDIRLICREETAILSLSNTCEPLEETSLTRIFDPFYRIEDNGKPGSGLGLAIVKKIVENLDGSITASPWKRNGICFEVRLPLTRP